MLHTHKPMSEADVKAMQERIEAHRAICKRVLGDKYICHPEMQVTRKDVKTIKSIVITKHGDGRLPEIIPIFF